jgi:hypothetical protein
VDQVGYAIGEHKRAFLLAEAPTAGTRFAVVDARGRTVLGGRVGRSAGGWNQRYRAVHPIDLSALRRPGTYRLDRRPSHLTDRRATVYATPMFEGDGGDVPAAPLRPAGGPVDVEGGWFDAGDFVKFTHATAYSTAELLVVPRGLDRGDRALAAETRHGLRWLGKVWDERSAAPSTCAATAASRSSPTCSPWPSPRSPWWSLVGRFRRARGVERLQLQWVALAALVVVMAGVVVLAGLAVGPASATTLIGVAVGLCLAALPVTTGAAVLRYRLYDLDRIIGRTLAYGLLTVLLGLGYAAVVLGLGRLLGRDSSLVVAAATLAVAAVFQPARRRVQRLVDRRFNRRRHDAGGIIDAFGARLRDQVDLNALNTELLAVVDQTMQPTTASLWLRATQAVRASTAR